MNEILTASEIRALVGWYAAYFVAAYLVSRWSYAVARRLPGWLDLDWRHQSETFLEKPDALAPPAETWWSIRSVKEDAQRSKLRWIPVLGPLLSKEYALFRNDIWLFGLTALAAILCSPYYVFTGLVFFGMLRCASMVDHESQLLPDCLTLPLLWFGLAKALVLSDPRLTVTESVAGAIVGFMFLWLIQKAYYLLRKTDGMGGGDLKIVAAIGAWIGVSLVPGAIAIGSIVGIGYAIIAAIRKKGFDRFAFGPSLAFGGMVMYYVAHLMPVYIDLFKAG